MNQMNRIDSLHGEAVARAAEEAVLSIPPAWPLTATVAVNPFLGQTHEELPVTSARLERIAGIRLAMPREYYAGKIASGEITDVDLTFALQNSPLKTRLDLTSLKTLASTSSRSRKPLPTVAELAAACSGMDWPALVADRIGTFAASYFDEGQAVWAASRRNGIYAAWRAFALHDLTPEIAGFTRFGLHIADTPETARGAIERACVTLGLGAQPGTYFHQLLLSMGGWAQYARHIKWKAELDGKADTTAFELLAIRLIFEEALYIRHPGIADVWRDVRRTHAEPVRPDDDSYLDSLLQTAAEHAEQKRLAAILAAPAPAVVQPLRPRLQAAFCIDVRSEVFRRALESLDPGIRTLGFAGFFGLGASHRGFASDTVEARLPVLLKPSVFSCTEVDGGAEAEADRQARFSARATRAWGRFRQAAVSSFAFVEAMGPVYAGKLLKDGLRLVKTGKPEQAKPRFAAEMPLEQRATMAETVLRAMSLTQNFASLVLLCGHGANVVNNPFASALHCGACGGHAGDVNARLLCSLLNDAEVRRKLTEKGIHIPEDTSFVAALHDTTTDRVTLFEADLDKVPADLATAVQWLEQAGVLTREERARRLPRASAQSILARAKDWAETRPELGLAGCRSFIAAPRARTTGRALDGEAFLHDYVWRQDDGFKVLELILTAPVVVASWISLQYYGSVVAPSLFGSGNKLLHNVVGGIGVFEGNGGNLRAGLPWQSVHDGETFAHSPLRLTVAVEAPKEAISEVLRRHENVRNLFDNGWLYLYALDDNGQMAWRYDGNLNWADAKTENASAPNQEKAG